MQRHKGFSLLEILVAFAIMAIALTIVLRIFGSGVNSAVTSEEYTLAVQIAESLMARTGVEAPLQAGDTQGVMADKYAWQVTVRPSLQNTPPTKQDDEQPQIHLMAVKVSVSWGDEHEAQRVYELSSLKLMQDEDRESPTP